MKLPWNKNIGKESGEESVKELLTYKDGEVVSVGTEPLPPPKEGERELPKESRDIRYYVANADKKHWLKVAISTFITVMILLILTDIYQMLNGEEESTTPNIDAPLVSTPNGGNVPNVSENTQPLTKEDRKYSWRELLEVTERVDAIMASQSSQSMEAYYSFTDGKMNRLALIKRLEKQETAKRAAQFDYMAYEKEFSKANLDHVFTRTQQRNEASIAFSQSLKSMLQNYQSSASSLVNEYVQEDEYNRESQQQAISSFLTDNNVDHAWNESLGEVEYQ